MVAKAFCLPAVFFLLSATVLLTTTTISLPYFTTVDVARVHFYDGVVSVNNDTAHSISQLRLGIWAYCADDNSTKARECSSKGHGYSVTLYDNTSGLHSSVTIKPSWTRGLAVHPVAAVASFIALMTCFSANEKLTLVSFITSLVAAFLTFVAFLIDIALYAWVHHEMGNLSKVSEHTVTGPGFWLTFAAFLLLILGGCTLGFGRRRERMASSSMTTKGRTFTSVWSRWIGHKV